MPKAKAADTNQSGDAEPAIDESSIETNQASITQANFAVNVDRSESLTEAIPVEKIEMFEVKVGEQKTASSELSLMREMRDRELEGQQKFWKWLIVAALMLLIGETWLAGRTATKMLANETQPSLQPSSGLSEMA